MYRTGIFVAYCDLYCRRNVVNFFSIILHWLLNLSEPNKVRKAGSSEFHQHQQLLLLSFHSTRAALAGQALTRL